MKTLSFIATALLAVVTGANFASCSNDDDDNNKSDSKIIVNPAKVFKEGIPSRVGSMSIICNADGLVTKISDDDEVVNFSYTSGSRASDYDVVMSTQEFDMYITLNKSGFASHCKEVMADGETEEWWFEYNSDGQLSKMRRTEGDNETTDISYSGGDIASVKVRNNDNDGDDNVINYGNSPIENKGCIMLFDETFGIDMDEMIYVYYAGMLGTATKSLPVSYSYTSYESGTTDTGIESFEWALNASGLPTSLVMRPSNEKLNFTW